MKRADLGVPVRKSFFILRHLGFLHMCKIRGSGLLQKLLTFLAQQPLVSRVPAALFGPLGVEFMPSDQVIEKTEKKQDTHKYFG